MELSMIKQNIEIAEFILDQEVKIYEQAKVLYKKGELAKESFDKVCERAIQADIALCDALIIASKNGYHPKKES
jgi:exonuclease VII small subunit